MAHGTTRRVRWGKAVTAGLVAGLVFMILEMALVPVFLGGSPWGPPRMIGAMALGEDVLPPPGDFDLVVVLVAMTIHFVLSVVFALTLAPVVHRLGPSAALAAGLAFGLLLYLVNFYGFTALWPWFASARNWVSIFAHLVFGGVAAWYYHRSAHGTIDTIDRI